MATRAPLGKQITIPSPTSQPWCHDGAIPIPLIYIQLNIQTCKQCLINRIWIASFVKRDLQDKERHGEEYVKTTLVPQTAHTSTRAVWSRLTHANKANIKFHIVSKCSSPAPGPRPILRGMDIKWPLPECLSPCFNPSPERRKSTHIFDLFPTDKVMLYGER